MSSRLLENTKAFLILMFHFWTLWPYEIIKSIFFSKKKKDINGEIMFITGAGSGIGRLMAVKFAACGATVICTDINKDTSDETAQMIKEKGGHSHSFQLDVTDRHDVYKLADEIKENIGEVTMLINNAGIVTGRKFMECSDELITKTMEVNTISHFWTLKAFLGPMMKKNRGHIISIASIAGYAGSPQMVDYCASKFGAVGITESLSLELLYDAPGVKITSICPWFIKTGMFEGAKSGAPLTMPMLEPDYAVEQIVSAVLKEEDLVFIPRSLVGTLIFNSIAPRSIALKLAEYMDLEEQMKNFTGRNTKKTD